MIKDFILPDIGEGVVECELVDWLVSEGEVIKEDQPVADVMTDKALVQIPAPYDGVVTKLYYQKGEIAKVHEPLFQVQLDGEESEPVSAESAPAAEVAGTTTELRDFILPDIGEGIVECEVVDWLVAEGDPVEEDQPICDVMTDKALVQIPAKEAGIIKKLYYRKGQVAKVHEPLFALEVTVTADEASVTAATSAQSQAPAPAAPATPAAPVPTGKALASPAVRRLAREHDLDLSLVPGSGKSGRVLKEDIQAYLAGGSASVEAAKSTAAPVAPAAIAAVIPASAEDRVEPIRGIKAAMARQMMASVQSIPHFTYCEELDLTELVALRARMKEQYAKEGVKLTLMPFFIKALSLAMREFPVLNSRVNDDCTEQTFVADHNIGMAVDGKLGLIVPNVKQVQHRSIVEVANEVTRLTQAARDGRVDPSDIKGGTISISNIGALGGTVATPIINKPEVAIVALGKLQTLPRFNERGEVEARTIMQVSWSGDHRVIDGGTIARFCNQWKQYLEHPESMMMAMS
ncbi:dihydrolipoyllysine-residue acetyltransferase [Ferrimonas balearica]|uniref:dihydrolipoyllysine-residue acetyltransferase n=1 Tax=Ferrimonas balearica TaxID=44012 RepID=UPI001C9913D4|nr:dihydrolipoyllysine-residue acetyltransferase [Ferrimonas balearica]MBY5920846.1 dihydrolipoyllysine-residue acetyltransferase [Ferrimonas balearica]MBY5996469.1 dihydrolipoyllysine-residue acetyltransferase [Ferrimonas balearica]